MYVDLLFGYLMDGLRWLIVGFAFGILVCARVVLAHFPNSNYKQWYEEERYVRISHERGILSCINNGVFVFMPGTDLGQFVTCKLQPIPK